MPPYATGVTRFMDNDQTNRQKPIPGDATVDFKLERRIPALLLVAEREQPVQRACTMTTRSASTFSGRPLRRLSAAGRTYMVKAGATF